MRDEQAFAVFVRARQTSLLRTAVLLTGNVADAEDLVQQALVRVAARWDAVEEPDAFARTVLARLATDRWRLLRSRVTHVPIAEGDVTGDPTGRVVSRAALLSELARLPRRQRAVLVLRYYEDWSEHDIAAALGCSPGTVKTHAARGLAKLRVAFTEGAAP